MCNFIIRPIKSYATVDYFEVRDEGGEQNEVMKLGEFLKVHSIVNDDVFGFINGDKSKAVTIPLNVFTHMFSDTDPNAKSESKKESK